MLYGLLGGLYLAFDLLIVMYQLLVSPWLRAFSRRDLVWDDFDLLCLLLADDIYSVKRALWFVQRLVFLAFDLLIVMDQLDLVWDDFDLLCLLLVDEIVVNLFGQSISKVGWRDFWFGVHFSLVMGLAWSETWFHWWGLQVDWLLCRTLVAKSVTESNGNSSVTYGWGFTLGYGLVTQVAG